MNSSNEGKWNTGGDIGPCNVRPLRVSIIII